VAQARLYGDLDLPPLRQSVGEVIAELGDARVVAAGWRADTGRLLAAVRVRICGDAPVVARVGRLAVVPDRRGQGLGSRLLHAVEGLLPAGVSELRLFTGERSEGNLRLYARHGYTETGREPTPAGYALVHLSKPRTSHDAPPGGHGSPGTGAP
jgi:GNAT superfamily N-acetyltransferase